MLTNIPTLVFEDAVDGPTLVKFQARGFASLRYIPNNASIISLLVLRQIEHDTPLTLKNVGFPQKSISFLKWLFYILHFVFYFYFQLKNLNGTKLKPPIVAPRSSVESKT